MSKIVVFFLLTSLFGTSVKAMMKAKKDLGNACQKIWDATGNNLKIPSELNVNLDQLDSKPLFEVQKLGQTKLGSEVFTSFKDLLQTNDENNQNKFLNVITKSVGPVGEAFKYLRDNGILGENEKKDLDAFKETLKYLWFTLLQGQMCNGFEHVFVANPVCKGTGSLLSCGEKGKLGKHYDGFHNWYQFYLEQAKGKVEINVKEAMPDLTYHTQPTFMQGLKFKWDKLPKVSPLGSSLFVGTSPAFDFAIFSTCAISLFKEKNVEVCTCKIHQTVLEIKAKQIFRKSKKNWVETHKISTAYPTSVVALVCTSILPTSRTDCGWLGINRHTCGKRGCCFDSQNYGDQTYWCFYPSDHRCHGIVPQNRKDCGFLGISRNECEGKGCCFDENFGQGVPHCFVGVPKG